MTSPSPNSLSKPPAKGKFWRAFAAVTILPINGSQKAVLGCLIDHANPKSGLCYPSEALIAAEIARPIRTVERAVADLLLTPYLSRKRRHQSSNVYSINFDALLKRGMPTRHAEWPIEWRVRKRLRKWLRNRRRDEKSPVKSGGSIRQKWRVIPSRVADKQKKRTGKEEKKSRMASPLRGDGVALRLFRLQAK